MTKKRKDDLIGRLAKFQIKGDPEKCYGWRGAICSGGFPRISLKGISIGANRAAWMAHYGKIPDFHYVRQRCNNKKCTNPAHLFISVRKGPKLKQSERVNARLHRERLSIDLPTKQVQGVKKNARKRNITITKYMSILIARALEIEKSYERQPND